MLHSFDHFRQRIFGDRDSGTGDLLQSPPTASHPVFFRTRGGRILPALIERAFDDNGSEPFVDDELRLCRVAADVAFADVEQFASFDQSEDEAEIQIAVGDLFDIDSADFAEVTLFAVGHDSFDAV